MRQNTGFRWAVALAMLAIPIMEIYVVFQVGKLIGAIATILLLILSSGLGVWLIKHEGMRSWRALRLAAGEGRVPTKELADGILVLVSGNLLLLPGFISDALALLLILPVSRPLARMLLAKVIAAKVLVSYSSGNGFGAQQSVQSEADVVLGEVIEDQSDQE